MIRCGLVCFLVSVAAGCSDISQDAEKKPVAVAHLAWIHWSLGPSWEPPGDEAQLKQFDEELDQLINGGTGHGNSNYSGDSRSSK